jgi:hypothetical protein
MTDPLHSDDEALSALLDGALTGSESERLLQRIAREPALAARFAELERADQAVRGAYRGIVDEPLPRDVVNLLAEDRAESAGGKIAADVVPFAARARPPRGPLLPLAFAAGIALAVGIALGVLVAARTPTAGALIAGVGPVDRASALHDVLETQSSGTRSELGADLTAEPRLTFATVAGEYCRQIDLGGAHGVSTAIACRHGDAWQVEILSYSGGAPNGDGVYRPAGAAPSAVDAAIDSLISGEPLGAAAERAAIDRAWAR